MGRHGMKGPPTRPAGLDLPSMSSSDQSCMHEEGCRVEAGLPSDHISTTTPGSNASLSSPCVFIWCKLADCLSERRWACSVGGERAGFMGMPKQANNPLSRVVSRQSFLKK